MASTCCGGKPWARRLLLIGVVAMLGMFVMKRTHVGQYIRHSVGEICADVEKNIPTKAKIAAFEQEIKDFENDVVRRRVGPIAELKSEVQKLRVRIHGQVDEQGNVVVKGLEQELASRNSDLSTLLSKLENDPQAAFVSVGSVQLTSKQARTRAELIFSDCQSLEKKLAVTQREFAAKNANLEKKLEEFNHLNAKLREFRADLAELKQRETELDVIETVDEGSSETSKFIQRIEERREAIKESHNIREYSNELNSQINEPSVTNPTTTNSVSLERMREYVNGQTKTVNE